MTILDTNIIPTVILFVLGISYILFSIWVIIEGSKREFSIPILILVTIFLSPFIAYAYVASVKRDVDRVKVTYINKNGVKQSISLAKWIKTGLPLTSILNIDDINKICRDCFSPFLGEEVKCMNCGKNRVWFKLIVFKNSSKNEELVMIENWQKIKESSHIKGIKRLNQP